MFSLSELDISIKTSKYNTFCLGNIKLRSINNTPLIIWAYIHLCFVTAWLSLDSYAVFWSVRLCIPVKDRTRLSMWKDTCHVSFVIKLKIL